jgi:hypothetical protein
MMEFIRRWAKRIGWTGGLVLLVLYIGFWAYALPGRMKVHITGTEVTRKDVQNAEGQLRTRDVRYIMAEDLDGEAHMFRNQDTGFGWPPVFKFNSGDLAAEAQAYATDHRNEIVLIKYYGFRIRVLSLFPNALSMETVQADYQPVPWETFLLVFLHFVLIVGGWILLRDRRESPDV